MRKISVAVFELKHRKALCLIFIFGLALAACGSSGSSGSASAGAMTILPKRIYTEDFEKGFQNWQLNFLNVPKRVIANPEAGSPVSYDIRLSNEINNTLDGKNCLEFSLFGDQEYIDAWIQREVYPERDMSFTLSFNLWSPQRTVYPRSSVLVYVGEKAQPEDQDFESVGVSERQMGWYQYSSKPYVLERGKKYTVASGLGTRWGLISHFYLDDVQFKCEDREYTEMVDLLTGAAGLDSQTAANPLKESFETGWNYWIPRAAVADDSRWILERDSREPSEMLDGVWTVGFYDQGKQGDTLWIYKRFTAEGHIERVRVYFSFWSEYISNNKKAAVMLYIGKEEPVDPAMLVSTGTTDNNSGWDEFDNYLFLTLDKPEEYYIALGLQLLQDTEINYFLDKVDIRLKSEI